MIKNSNSIFGKSLIYGLGNLGTLAINFFLVPLYTFYLSTDELGVFDLIASAVPLIIPICFFHLELAALRWLTHNTDSNLREEVVSTITLVLGGVLLFLSILTVIVRSFLDFDFSIVIYLTSAFLFAILKQIIRCFYSSAHYVITEFLYLASVVVVVIIYGKELSLDGVFLSYGFGLLMVLIYLFFMGFFSHIKFHKFSLPLLQKLTNYSFPLTLNTAFLWVNNHSLKYIILGFLGLSSNGLFALAFKFAYVIQTINRIFYLSFQDKSFEKFEKPDFSSYFTKVLNQYFNIIFSLCLLIISVKNLLIPLIIESSFVPAMKQLPVLALGVVFMSLSSILGILFQCAKKNILAFSTSVISGVSVVILGLALVPFYGLYGASYSFLLGNIIWFFSRIYYLRNIIRLQLNYLRLLFLTLLVAVATLVSTLCTAGYLLFVFPFVVVILVFYLNIGAIQHYWLKRR